MSEKNDLLGDLKIDRTASPASRRNIGVWVGVALLVGVAGIGGVMSLGSEDAVEVRTAIASRTGGSSGGASVLDASGYVIARRAATVSSKITGKVVDVLIEEGMRVDEGQVLARLDDNLAQAQLALAESQYRSAEAGLEEVLAQLVEARRQHQRNRRLARDKLVSLSAVDASQANLATLTARHERSRRDLMVSQRNVELLQQQLSDTVIRAPFAGTVTVKAAQPGEMISPVSAGGGFTRTGIGTLVDMSSLEIEVDVNENFINRVSPNQPAVARMNAYPDWEIPARVIAIVPTADRQKATVRVRVQIDTEDARVLPEMGVRVAFLPEKAESAVGSAPAPVQVLAPVAAVLEVDGGHQVFIVRGNNVKRQTVLLGERLGDRVVIREGLAGSETLAVSALASLTDGSRVTIQK